VKLAYPRNVGRNAKLGNHGTGPTSTAVVLKTDRGASGWGALIGRSQSLDTVRPAAMGRAVADLFAPERGILKPELKPLDFALHDLAGVILGQPVWRMLGAASPEPPKVYSGMVYFDDLDPDEKPAGIGRVVENCLADRALGYRQLKIKIGRGNKWMPREAGDRRDAEVVRAVAKACPDCEILVDANDGYDADGFIRFLEAIGDIPLFWIEEPFVEDEAAWRKVHAWTRAHGRAGTLLADGEQHNDFPLLERLEDAGILQVRLTDIADVGFTGWRELMPRLKARKVLASPHCWGSGLKTVYTAHLAAALGNTPTIEGVTCASDAVDFGGNVIRDGRQQLPDAPGFGLKMRGE
jgi:L-alanine-DL-glutamate epimerase-like enolase superfamily enzyme